MMTVIDLNFIEIKCYPLKTQNFFKGGADESWIDNLFPTDGSSSDA
jgi:hypothetical protein